MIMKRMTRRSNGLRVQTSFRGKLKFFQAFLLAMALGPLVKPLSLGAEEVSLTLAETFAWIEKQNLEVLIQRQAVEEAFQTVLRERSELIPRFSFDTTQIRTQIAPVGFGFDFAPPPPVNRFDGKMVGSVPLINVVNYANWRLSRYNLKISELTLESVQQDSLNNAANAFYSHLRNLKRIEVLDANIKRDESLLDLATNQLNAGVATKIDVTRAESALATDQKQRLQQDTVVMESGLRFKLLLDLDLDAHLNLKGSEQLKPIQFHREDYKLETLLEVRPDYLIAVEEMERNLAALKYAGLERLPSVNLFGEWGYATEEVFDGGEKNTWQAGISLSLPVFEGFRIRSNKRRAKAVILSQEFVIRNIENQIGADYKLALQDSRSRYDQIGITRKRVELSEEELDLAQTRFMEGVADNREIIDALAALADASDEMIEIVYQYNLSRLALSRAKGDVRLLLSD